MAKQKRRFTTPLGSGAAPSLRNDPRIRRDRAARSTSVPDPLVTTAEVTALEARIADLEAAAAGALTEDDIPGETEVTSSPATWQFELSASGTDYGYASYGNDGEWEAQRWDATTLDTITGIGTKPTSLSDFTNLSWPVPAP